MNREDKNVLITGVSGFKATYSVEDIIRDQLNYFLDEKKRV